MYVIDEFYHEKSYMNCIRCGFDVSKFRIGQVCANCVTQEMCYTKNNKQLHLKHIIGCSSSRSKPSVNLFLLARTSSGSNIDHHTYDGIKNVAVDAHNYKLCNHPYVRG